MPSKTILSLLSLLPTLYAYKVDSSCSGSDASLMKTAAEQAFDMASQAYDALTMTGIRDSNVDRLVELLFCREGQSAADLDTSALINSFLGIKSMRNENADPGNNPDEVVIYCDMERLEERDDGWYDTVTGIALEDPPDHELQECRDKKDRTLMYTWVPENEDQQPIGPGQVTICPWFLQYSRQLKYKTFKDISSKYLKALFQIPLSTTKLGPFEPIDTVNLLDKVLLHEFTHTVAGGRTLDVNWPDNEMFGKAYGWSSCKELAKSGQVGADYNADTLALFGSGIRLLKQEPPAYITDDGRVTKKNPAAKRAVPSYFEYPRSTAPSRAFETFITVIKERRAMATTIVS
ncbi:hypothetical protein PRZ48_006617 [Zasmidium cellare]|uniref:Lysine-specific metallo-endopeptidase domain-containing protein n=1 Tax=Zasmidium cellare TaxID=395010 RepID=A0ABR0EP86_ZASCE|nr:hypothetical protein PRZ48_006617 [Zasmidium cellare]